MASAGGSPGGSPSGSPSLSHRRPSTSGGVRIKSQQELFNMTQSLIDASPQGVKGRLQLLWQDMRRALDAQNTEVNNLRQQLARATNTAPAARPNTAVAVQNVRFGVEQAMNAAARLTLDEEAVTDKLAEMDPDYARNKLHALRDSTARNLPGGTDRPGNNPLGCWLTPINQESRGKVNLRNSAKPAHLGGGVWDMQPWRHQLAAVASGQGGQLPLTAGGWGSGFNPAYHV